MQFVTDTLASLSWITHSGVTRQLRHVACGEVDRERN